MRFVCLYFLFLKSILGCESFVAGNEAYFKGDYAQAVRLYQLCANPSVALLNNLGSAFFQIQEFGQARLSFERGLVLKPFDSQLLYNMSLVDRHLKEGDAPDFRRPAQYFTHLGLVFFGLSLLFSLLVLLRHRLGRSPAILGGVLFFGMGCYVLFQFESYKPLALVFKKEVPLRSGPSQSALVAGKLVEGQILPVLDTSGAFLLIQHNPPGWTDELVLLPERWW